MLLAMILFGVLVASLGGMVRQHAVGAPMPPGFFVLMAIAAPLGLMILLSLLRALWRWGKDDTGKR